MEVLRVNEYRFEQVYLYPPVNVPGVNLKPFGAVQLEVFGHRGMLVCRTNWPLRKFLREHPEASFPVFLRKENSPEDRLIGYLSPDKSGCGVYQWEFNNAGTRYGSAGRPLAYLLQIGFRPDGGKAEGRTGTRVLMEGRFILSFEVKDTRVVGFKKEVKAAKKGLPAQVKNPLFQKVEPFDPPIPDTVWWLISIQPDFRSALWQKEYCPRQERYKAVF